MIRRHIDEIVDPDFPGHREQTQTHRPFRMSMSRFPGNPPTNPVGQFQGSFSHEQAPDFMGIAGAASEHTATAFIHNHMNRRAFNQIMHNL
jgi:hypothetical protein